MNLWNDVGEIQKWNLNFALFLIDNFGFGDLSEQLGIF